MMYAGRKEIIEIVAFGKKISALYIGDKLVWIAIRSCFGGGFWKNENPWLNVEGWKN